MHQLANFFRMGLKFGDIDITAQTLQNEYTSLFILELISLVLEKNPTLQQPSSTEIESIKAEIVKKLQDKYPNSGIEPKR